MASPQAKREAVTVLMNERHLRFTRACGLVGVSRSLYRYQSRRPGAGILRSRIGKIAAEKRRYGYRRIHVLLKREGFTMNVKRTYRLYREAGLAVRRHKRKRIGLMERKPLPKPTQANVSGSMDFVADGLANGRRIRCLTLVDDCTRECLAIEVDTSLTGMRVVSVLQRLADTRGLPQSITVDHGPEFEGKALDEWAYRRSVTLDFIRTGKPVEHGFIESFNGRFRDECLNEHWFITMNHARDIIEHWRHEYNTVRPHSSLGNQTPEAYARARQQQVSCNADSSLLPY